jgi:hypothetical protein
MGKTNSCTRSVRRFTALFSTFAVAAASCASREPRPIEFETGALAEVTAEGLHRVKDSRFSDAWVRPGVDFASYRGIQLVPVKLTYKNAPAARRSGQTRVNDFALTETQKQAFESLFLEVFDAELAASPYFSLDGEPGPGVLRVEASVIDLVVKVPTEVVSNERTFTSSTASMSLLLELYDSQAGEILARMTDRRDALGAGHGGSGSLGDLYYSNPSTDTDAVRRVFRRWAKTLRARLDEVHELALLRD